MRAHCIFADLLLLSSVLVSSVSGQTCSCKATDNKSEGSVSCPNGCMAICSDKDSCYVGCGENISYARINLSLDRKDGKSVAGALSQTSGRRIIFIPRRRGERFTIEAKNGSIWDILSFLSHHGQVSIDGTNFKKLEEIRNALRRGDKITLNFTDVSIKNAVAKISFLSGLPFHVASERSRGNISISFQGVTLNELISHLSEQTGVRIELSQE